MLKRINVSCSRTQNSDAGETRTHNPSISSQALSHCAPSGTARPVSIPLSISTFVNRSLERLLAKFITCKVSIDVSVAEQIGGGRLTLLTPPPPAPKTCFLAIQRFKTSSCVSTSTTTPNLEPNMGPDVRKMSSEDAAR